MHPWTVRTGPKCFVADAFSPLVRLRLGQDCDIVSLDPPYAMMQEEETLAKVLEAAVGYASCLRPGGWFVLRTPEIPNTLRMTSMDSWVQKCTRMVGTCLSCCTSVPPRPTMGQAEYQAACQIVRALKWAGHEAVLAGGCVRDRLLGIVPKDYDVATSATPEQVKAVFPGSKGVGEAFAVVLVRHEEVVTEVATFRKDGPYADGRRPDYVELDGATMEEDAARRDFTINGLFEDPDGEEASKVIDFHDGVADLKKHRCVRAIGDPAARIAEDRLRMLRAVRFAARFGFHIEAATKQAIVKHAPNSGRSAANGWAGRW